MEGRLPESIELRVVTPVGEVIRETVDEVVAPGAEGYFGVRPGHTPLMATLGLGELSYRRGERWQAITCFSGFCEVLPDRVTVLADVGERAEEIDVSAAEEARQRALTRLKAISEEAQYDAVHDEYVRAVTRLAVARERRGP